MSNTIETSPFKDQAYKAVEGLCDLVVPKGMIKLTCVRDFIFCNMLRSYDAGFAAGEANATKRETPQEDDGN